MAKLIPARGPDRLVLLVDLRGLSRATAGSYGVVRALSPQCPSKPMRARDPVGWRR